MNDITQLNSYNYLCKLFKWDVLSRNDLDKIEEEVNKLDDKTREFIIQKNLDSKSIYDFLTIEDQIVLKVKDNKNVEFNKKLRWDLYDWEDDGDERNDMAEYDWVSYEDWKNSLINNFITPYIWKDVNILEIAVWHWRWSKYLLQLYKNYYWIDISNECINFCKRKFSEYDNCNFILWNWVDLKNIESDSINFIFSFDSFVHISQDVFIWYIKEISRILAPNWICIIHHSGVKNKNQIRHSWYRASCCTNIIYNEAENNKLKLVKSLKTRWDKEQYSVKKFDDIISIFKKCA